MDNRTLFTGKSDDYFRCRPGYPESSVRWLKERCSGEKVVDIGAGTGIFTKVLLNFFSSVSALEPNADMQRCFRDFLPDTVCLPGSGEATGLPDNSVDLITVAQAFHWLDEEKFKAEAMRILRPGGKVAIVWNTALKNDFSAARDRISRQYCPRFRSGHAGKRSPEEGDAFLRYHYFSKVEIASFDNPFVMDLETFEGNVRSRSYALTPDHPDYQEFMAKQRTVLNISQQTVLSPNRRKPKYFWANSKPETYGHQVMIPSAG